MINKESNVAKHILSLDDAFIQRQYFFKTLINSFIELIIDEKKPSYRVSLNIHEPKKFIF